VTYRLYYIGVPFLVLTISIKFNPLHYAKLIEHQ